MAVYLSPNAFYGRHTLGTDIPENPTQISWCGWRKIPQPAGVQPMFYMHRGGPIGQPRVIVWHFWGQAVVTLQRFTSSTPTFDTIAQTSRPASEFWDEWVFIGCTVEDEGDGKLFVATPTDTIVAQTDGSWGSLGSINESVVFGSDFFTSDRIDGAVSHDRLWVDELLSYSDMDAERNSPIPVYPDPFGDWRHYALNGHDSSGNDHHLQLHDPDNATLLMADSAWPEDASGTMLIDGGGEFSAEGIVAPPNEAIGVDWAVYGIGMKYIRKRVRN